MTSIDGDPARRWSARSALRRARCWAPAGAEASTTKAHAVSRMRRRPDRKVDDVISGAPGWGLIPPAVVRRRARFRHRVDQHPLRAAESTDSLKTPITDPVVNRPPRDAEDLRRMVQRDAAADTRLETFYRIAGRCHQTVPSVWRIERHG